MNFLDRVSNALSWRLVNANRTRARHDLLKRSDRFLADNGFSRALLEQGNDRWPWRVDGPLPADGLRFALQPAGLRASMSNALLATNYAQAETELRAMSGAELSGLGIARKNLAATVRDGRPGVDEAAPGTDERPAARAGTRGAQARRQGRTHRARMGSIVVLAAAALGAGIVSAAEPDAQAPADVATNFSSVWLVAGTGIDGSFHTNPRIGEAAEPSVTAARDPLAPATGIWYTTHSRGKTCFDTNPVIESEAGPERHVASR